MQTEMWSDGFFSGELQEVLGVKLEAAGKRKGSAATQELGESPQGRERG